MKMIKILFLFCGAILLVLLDVSFFANLTIGGANLMSSFIFVIMSSLILDQKYLVFIISCALAFTILSSLPVIMILLGIVVLPVALHFFQESFFPEPTILTFPIYFVSASLIFELLLLITAKEFSIAAVLPIIYFILINSVAATVVFAILARVRKVLSPNKIKI